MDRLIARYLWQGKKARIKFKTLQLRKDKGGMGLPCLQEYYHVAQLRPLVCLCSPTYTAAWKEIEGTMINGIPITTLLSDNKLLGEQEIPDDSIIGSFLESWQEIVKICSLGDASKIMRWCAYDSDFVPNRTDGRFRTWITKGLNNVFNVNIPFECETLYLGNIMFEAWNTSDRKLLAMLLAASKKSITRNWLKAETPTIDEWVDIVYEIYIMERISFSLKVEKEKFYKIWTKRTEYVKPIRSDFT